MESDLVSLMRCHLSTNRWTSASPLVLSSTSSLVSTCGFGVHVIVFYSLPHLCFFLFLKSGVKITIIIVIMLH